QHLPARDVLASAYRDRRHLAGPCEVEVDDTAARYRPSERAVASGRRHPHVPGENAEAGGNEEQGDSLMATGEVPVQPLVTAPDSPRGPDSQARPRRLS